MLNEVKTQLKDVEKEMKEQRELMNSIMMLPKKVEYLVDEAKKEINKKNEDLKMDCAGNLKELRDYI